MRVLVACGAAGGIAATFNAPLAGVFFAMELILRRLRGRVLRHGRARPSVTASVIGRAVLGNAPVPAPARLHASTTRRSTCCSPRSASVAGLRRRAVHPGAVRDRGRSATGLWRGPEWLRPAVGGLLLGGLLLVAARRCTASATRCSGNAVAGGYAIAFLLVLLVGKMLATSLTIGIGGSGGVFAPSLFIGAMLGAAFGAVAHAAAALAWPAPAGAYGLVGMGAVFAGAARAPITAVVIMFELTGEYTIILPLMARHRARHRRQPPASAATPSTPSSCAAAASTSGSARPSTRPTCPSGR